MSDNTKTINHRLTPTGNNSITTVTVNPQEKCNKVVNMALEKTYGHCSYYYVPYNGDQITEKTKLDYVDKNGINFRYIYTHAPIFKIVKDSQSTWDFANDVMQKVIKNREALLALDSGDPNWSRYADFMKRHTATCGHLPPTYYRAYGYYYCSRFVEYLMPSMKTIKSKEWLVNARYLLQKYMDDGLKQNNEGTRISLPSKLYPKYATTMSFEKQTVELDDTRFKTFAFKSHVPAYLDGGIGEIGYADTLDLLRIMAEPNLQEWMDIETMQQAVEVAETAYPKTTFGIKVVVPGANIGIHVIKKWDDIKKIWTD